MGHWYHIHISERFLDPSAGTGMFISTLKDVPEIHCFEKDRLTGRILSSLYPKSRVTIDGFQSIQPYYNGYFDVVSSNIPFGNTRIYDRDFDQSDDPVRKSSLAAVHNYFFLKGMDTLRDGRYCRIDRWYRYQRGKRFEVGTSYS